MSENENAFKHFISPEVVRKISRAIIECYPDFDSRKFLKLIPELSDLELKARVLLVTQHLSFSLPRNYPKALKILVEAMERGDLKSFELWPFSEYISQFGLSDLDPSMKAMYQLTQRFTAEFAVRPFLIQSHTDVLNYFENWIEDKNVHVRRWISEGSRPLLPWGMRIPLFVGEPNHTLKLLEQLRHDEELYVRKSVANHLNDISKNHPDVVVATLGRWNRDVPLEHLEKIKWITRQALRTLIKKGDPKALKLMGVDGAPKVELRKLSFSKNHYKLNDILEFDFEIVSTSKKPQKVIIDYSIDFVRANGKVGKKVFKLKTVELGAMSSCSITKKHSLRPITTMKYYSGLHTLKVQVNGVVLGQKDFKFTINPT
jgi:3-methyladenine DNA glycosylase AlkC